MSVLEIQDLSNDYGVLIIFILLLLYLAIMFFYYIFLKETDVDLKNNKIDSDNYE